MDVRGWRRLVGGASIVAGLLMAFAIAYHAVSVTGTALDERGGLDERWAVLQLIGAMAAGAGILLAVTGGWLWNGRGQARDVLAANGAAALFLALLLAVTGVLGLAGPAAYAAYLVLLAACARKLGASDNAETGRGRAHPTREAEP